MLRVPDQRNGLQGGYPDNVMLILEVCQEGGLRSGVLGGHYGFLTGDMEDLVWTWSFLTS